VRAGEDATKLSEDLQSKLLPPIAAMVNTAIEAYAMANNLAAVFDPTIEGSNIVFANKAADITNQIMRMVNDEWAKSKKSASTTSSTPEK
jgi:Skp family chaperone for outer membrane proteins